MHGAFVLAFTRLFFSTSRSRPAAAAWPCIAVRDDARLRLQVSIDHIVSLFVQVPKFVNHSPLASVVWSSVSTVFLGHGVRLPEVN